MTSEMGNVNESVTLANADMRDVDGERRHDPLCLVDAGSCCPWMGECECQCDCEWIECVREDEQDKQYTAQSENWVKGYECALRDAIEAIRKHVVSGYFCSCGAEINTQAGHHVLVIHDLGGER